MSMWRRSSQIHRNARTRTRRALTPIHAPRLAAVAGRPRSCCCWSSSLSQDRRNARSHGCVPSRMVGDTQSRFRLAHSPFSTSTTAFPEREPTTTDPDTEPPGHVSTREDQHTPSSSSTSSSSLTDDSSSSGPSGTLFHAPIDNTLLHKYAEIRRTFPAQTNAQGLLVCGGASLAKHASFDPTYRRAQTWIRHHAVGPAVLSPLLTTGLIQALVEAALPQAIVLSTSFHQVRPMIVGVQVCARIQVVQVVQDEASDKTSTTPSPTTTTNTTTTSTTEDDFHHAALPTTRQVTERSNGYQVTLETSVARVRDKALIATGTHDIWIPDYLHM